MVLTKNEATGKSRVWIVGITGSRTPLSTDYFYTSDVPYSYGAEYGINAIAEYNGRLYAACDNGLVIMFTECFKCYQLKKAADIDLKFMTIEGDTMIAGDGETEVAIPMSQLGGDSIEPDEAYGLVAAGAVLVDVRSAEEFAEKSVAGSVNIPVDQIETGLTGYSKDTVLIFYCASGGRASKAVEIAKAMGFENVYNLGSIDKLI